MLLVQLNTEIRQEKKSIIRLLSKGMSNIYVKVTIEKN